MKRKTGVLFVVWLALALACTIQPAALDVATPVVSATPTRTATATIAETPTPTTTVTPTVTPTRQATARPSATPLPFTAQPVVAQGDIYGGGCGWMGIAGQVFGADGRPLVRYIVRLNGGGYVDIDALTGSRPAYGPGGYEFFVHTPVISETYTVQVLDPDGTALSEAVVVVTTADCEHNLYIVNWKAR